MSAGGKREGAGRKPMPPLLKKTPRSIKLPEWLWRYIDDLPDTNRALTIEAALIEKHGWEAPDEK